MNQSFSLIIDSSTADSSMSVFAAIFSKVGPTGAFPSTSVASAVRRILTVNVRISQTAIQTALAATVGSREVIRLILGCRTCYVERIP